MLRAPRPEMVSASTLTGAFDCGPEGRCVSARVVKEAASVKPKNVDESQRESLLFMIGESFLVGRGLGGLSLRRLLRVGGRGVGRRGGRRGGGGGAAGAGAGAVLAAVLAKRESSSATLASIFSYVTFERLGLPFTPLSMEKGRYQPPTSL